MTCIRGVAALNLGILGLANNHILDHGPAGLESTLAACQAEGIATVGAGRSAAEARRTLWRTVGDHRIAIIAAAEEEFCIAGRARPGANPLDAGAVVLDVVRAAERTNDVVVLLHAGYEGYRYPSPRLRRVCHQLVDAGARLVVCQHSHIPGCMEAVDHAAIVYGQGNFLFDYEEMSGPGYDEGALLRVVFDGQAAPEVSLVPFRQRASGAGISPMTSVESDAFRRKFAERSAEIQEPGFVEAQWERFCLDLEGAYLARLLSRRRLVRSALRRAHFHRWFWTADERRTLLNLVRCSIHREVLQTVLERGHAS